MNWFCCYVGFLAWSFGSVVLLAFCSDHLLVFLLGQSVLPLC